MYRKELLKGSTESLLLAVLEEGPLYGYQIAREMEQRSSGYFRFKEGTLYPALHRLEKAGMLDGMWEAAPSGQQRRYYHITTSGLEALARMMDEWRSFSRAVNLVIDPGLA